MSGLLTWFLVNVIIPSQLCIATQGAYVPENQQAKDICYAVIGNPMTTFF